MAATRSRWASDLTAKGTSRLSQMLKPSACTVGATGSRATALRNVLNLCTSLYARRCRPMCTLSASASRSVSHTLSTSSIPAGVVTFFRWRVCGVVFVF